MTIDLGDVYQLSYDHYDVSGALASSTSATWTITLPDGTTDSFAASVIGAGLYRNNYSTVQAGRHLARWVGTGTAAGAYTEAFDVRPADPIYLISLAEAKAHLNMTSSTHDDELRAFIEASTKAAEDHRDEVLVRRTFIHHTDRRQCSSLVLPRVPVVSLTSVATVDAATTWDVADLHVDGTSGRVTVESGPLLDGHLRVTYVAGYPIVPAAFTLAVKIIVQHLWETQRGPQGATRFAGTIDDASLLRFRSINVFVPPRAQELLGDRMPMV